MLEKNKIYHVDCLESLKYIDDSSIDLLIADYPFNCQDGKQDYDLFIKETSHHFFRVLKENCILIVINNPKNIFKYSHHFSDFQLRDNLILMRKSTIRPAWHFAFKHNICQILIKPQKDGKINIKHKWNGTKKNHDKEFMTDLINYQNGYLNGKDSHPQAIPLTLTKQLIELFSDKNDLILDPFFGSGTTGVACKELHRDYMGFEYFIKYVELARRRLTKDIIKTILKVS